MAAGQPGRQFSLLGQGDPAQKIRVIARNFHGGVSVQAPHAEERAHGLHAGNNLIHDSGFELSTQRYARQFSVIAVVRPVRGLVDAVADGAMRGFHFQASTAEARL